MYPCITSTEEDTNSWQLCSFIVSLHYPDETSLQVMFTPGGHSHAPQYKQGIPIKITHNNKGPIVMCTASSFTLKAAFDPPLLDLGAILPRFDSQQPNQALLKLINTADVDMEVGMGCICLCEQCAHMHNSHRSCLHTTKCSYPISLSSTEQDVYVGLKAESYLVM
jgi:hypothetical protein